MAETRSAILSISVGPAAPLAVPGGRTVLSGIRKQPVAGPVQVGRLNLAGDEQADLQAHGGLRKAVFAYPSEHLPFWVQERRQRGIAPYEAPLQPGFMGENLLLEGLTEDNLWMGDVLHFEGSDCILRITQPREPCYKFCAVMGWPQAARAMVQKAICGFYLAVDEVGVLQAGMKVKVAPGQRSLSLVEAVHAKWAKHRN